MVNPKEILAKCDTCRFSLKQRMRPTDLTSVLVCRRNPPTPVIMNQNGQVGQVSLFPIVQESNWCYRYEHSPGAVLAGPVVTANERN